MRLFLRFAIFPAVAALLLLAGVVWFLSEGMSGERHPRGRVAARPVPSARVAERAIRRGSGDRVGQILFGDLHVHTTYSADAFIFSLPLMQGEGVHPPADACDFARFCAELDFWSINDHAEYLTPWQWAETRKSIRECNAVSGDPDDPDLVSFLGWEWTQDAPPIAAAAGRAHYGHKNVILLGTEDGEVPDRPVGAGSGGAFSALDVSPIVWALVRAGLTLGDFPGDLRPYLDFNAYVRDVRALEDCPGDGSVRNRASDCFEGAATPAELFAKLDAWGYPSLVIPHGTAWGIHAPPEADLADQLAPGEHDPARQRLFEVYSGHGSSELWRDQPQPGLDAAGRPTCPAPRDGFEPCCWRAGEIIRERCGAVAPDVCDERAADARRWFLEAPETSRFGVVPGTAPEDWRECGQLAGTFLPALDYRPRMSAAYGLAVRPDGGGAFRYGLIASSDNHKARAGAGYKELGRKAFGDAYGFRQDWIDRLSGEPTAPAPLPIPPDQLTAFAFADPGTERNASYYYTAGLVAVHAAGRDRRSIFDALSARRAYGTSGPRILLWFELQNGVDGVAPMGSEARVPAERGPPRFVVRALGDFVQIPGCPDHTRERLSAERLERLCLNECYHPSDERYPIDRIEVVRIRPQVRPDELLGGLIEDPWRTFECPQTASGCRVEFEDLDYDASREHVYYVRALQVPSPAVNGDPMRCERRDDGACLRARLCPAGGPDFDPDDECLAPVRERAWSSPIWLSSGALREVAGTGHERATPR